MLIILILIIVISMQCRVIIIIINITITVIITLFITVISMIITITIMIISILIFVALLHCYLYAVQAPQATMIPLSLAHFTNYKEVMDADENYNHDDDNYDDHLHVANKQYTCL